MNRTECGNTRFQNHLSPFQHKMFKEGKWTAKSRKGRLLHISLSIQIQSIDNKSNDAICAGGIALQLQDQMVYLDHYNIEALKLFNAVYAFKHRCCIQLNIKNITFTSRHVCKSTRLFSLVLLINPGFAIMNIIPITVTDIT